MINERLSLRAGAGILPNFSIFWSDESTLTIAPLTLNYLAGSGSHRMELGGGIIFGLWDGSSLGILGTGTLGYRYQPLQGGLMFRIGFTPVFAVEGIYPLAGVSAGVTF